MSYRLKPRVARDFDSPGTAKPFLYVFNMDDGQLVDEAARTELAALVAPAEAIFLDAQIESELAELDDDEGRRPFPKGLSRSLARTGPVVAAPAARNDRSAA